MLPVRKLGWLILLASFCFLGFLQGASVIRAEDFQAEVQRGEELFRRDWSKHDPVKDGPPGSDGLGPLFNAVSCVACHSQGGTGGAGENKHNLQLLTLVRSRPFLPAPKMEFTDERRAILVTHPNLKEHDSTVVHRASIHAEYQKRAEPLLNQPRAVLIGKLPLDPLSQLASEAVPGAKQNPDVIATLRTERNTPSLFGAGLIDAIQDEWLDKIERDQNRDYPELAGEVAPNHAKFGWRGQIQSLQEFVQAACANELGLQTKGFPQPVDTISGQTAPVLPILDEDGNAKIIPDIYPFEVTALVRFIEQLPPPEQVTPDTSAERFLTTRGRRHFHQIQCGVCHQERIGMVKGIYSDLLLHDMGPELWDPVSLGQDLVGSYARLIRSGGNLTDLASGPEQKWRTPPLWGVRDTAPYLHDGRAETLEEAILAHGGQAESSRRKYERLTPGAKRELLAFVESLGAPPGGNILALLEKKHRLEMAVSKPEVKPVESGDLESGPRLIICGGISFHAIEGTLIRMPNESAKFFSQDGAKP